MPAESIPKTCFVIAPIGTEASAERKHSDNVLKYIIIPVVTGYGYKAIRADHMANPGNITLQVIQHLVQADLVVADLSGHNPNVFYELAIRHAARKPTIHLIKEGERIPFDVASYRTIKFDPADMASVAHCRDELSKQIHAIEEQPSAVDNPVSMALDLQGIHKSNELLPGIQEAIRASLSSDEVITRLVHALSRGDRQHTEERVARVLDSVVDQTAAQVRDVNLLTIDPTPLVGSRSSLQEVWQVDYNRYPTITVFLNAIWFALSSTGSDVPAYTYGEVWILRDADSGKVFKDIGSRWVGKEQRLEIDNRSLREIGILPGMTLEIIPLRRLLTSENNR